MEYLFSSTGLYRLQEQLQYRAVFALDFDGTLAQITSFPEAARMRPITQNLLKQLARRDYVTVISGRSLADLKRRVHQDNVRLVGNHGVESEIKDYSHIQDHAGAVCAAWKSDLIAMLRESQAGSSIDIEDKHYSLSLHYRRSTNYSFCLEAIRQAIRLLTPNPRVLSGKAVVNLLPPGLPNKGHAFMDAMLDAKLSHGFFVGDDATDEDVFVNGSASLFTIRVGYDPDSAAQFYLRDQTEIERLMRIFVSRRVS